MKYFCGSGIFLALVFTLGAEALDARGVLDARGHGEGIECVRSFTDDILRRTKQFGHFRSRRVEQFPSGEFYTFASDGAGYWYVVKIWGAHLEWGRDEKSSWCRVNGAPITPNVRMLIMFADSGNALTITRGGMMVVSEVAHAEAPSRYVGEEVPWLTTTATGNDWEACITSLTNSLLSRTRFSTARVFDTPTHGWWLVGGNWYRVNVRDQQGYFYQVDLAASVWTEDDGTRGCDLRFDTGLGEHVSLYIRNSNGSRDLAKAGNYGVRLRSESMGYRYVLGQRVRRPSRNLDVEVHFLEQNL